LTPRASPLVRAIRQRCTDESYSSRGRAGRGGGEGYCDARNIFIPKVRIVSPAATTCTKDRPPGVAPLRAAFYIFHFRDRAGHGRQHEGRRIQKHYKTQFPASTAGAIFRATERRGWANAAGAQCVLDETSIACRGRARAQREGVVSISGAKRLPRN